jgi:hypothetical protein
MDLEALIGPKTVGLLLIPADYATPRAGLLALWRRHVVANAGVRDRAYMESLFKSHFPHSELIVVEGGGVSDARVAGADNIVLLYADSIGMDFGAIERNIVSHWPLKRVLVLNGRRRMFRLDPDMRRRLALRRFLEVSRLPEIAFLLAFFIATPVLLLLDTMKSRR